MQQRRLFHELQISAIFICSTLFASNNLHADTGTFSGYTMELNGDAAIFGNTLRLTPDENFKRGSAFIVTPFKIEADTSFSTFFRLSMYGTDGTNGADGITFILQDDPAGANAPLVLGNLGYINMVNSIAVEYDTFKSRDPNDPNDNHLGIDVDGDVESLINSTAIPDLNNGTGYYTWIDYDGETDLLEVYLSDVSAKPSVPSLSYNIDLTQYVRDKAYVGFGASNGNPRQAHDVEDWVLEITSPVQMLEVPIDIEPGRCPNRINKRKKRAITLSIQGTSTFDVSQIDIASIRLQGVSPIRSFFEDVGTPYIPSFEGVLTTDCTSEGPDGTIDLVLKFNTTEILNAIGTVKKGEVLSLKLTGLLQDGTSIEGRDIVKIQKKHKRRKICED